MTKKRRLHPEAKLAEIVARAAERNIKERTARLRIVFFMRDGSKRFAYCATWDDARAQVRTVFQCDDTNEYNFAEIREAGPYATSFNHPKQPRR